MNWSGSANGSVIVDATNRQFEVDATSRDVVDIASNATLTGLTVDGSANLLSNGTKIGYVGLAASNGGGNIAVFDCTDGSTMTITVSPGTYSYSCGSGSGGGTGGGSGSGSGGGSTTSFSQNETGEINATLTGAQPNYADSGGLTLTQTTRVWAFSWAQYSAAFWAVDATNAALLRAGQAFSGYRLAPAGQSGMNYVTLPAGTWYVGVVPNQTVTSSYSNRIYAELSVTTLPGANEVNDVGMMASANPGGWNSQGFTLAQGSRAFLETEGAGGTFMVMSPSQYSSFQSAYAGGYTGGSYTYTYACGSNSGGQALEIECELQLTPGTWYLVYLNTTSSASGGAANVGFFQ